MIYLSKICQRVLPLALLATAVAAQAGGLPDTGISNCYNDTVADSVPASNAASISRDAGTHPRQDCRYGRDPAALAGGPKIGGGAKGLDYTKIANNGSSISSAVALGSGATSWACTQDNITGLIWEVKTTSGLRSATNTYTWLNSNAASNGGVAGTANGGTCSGGGSGCDTEKYVADVNGAGLCGFTDWRLPSERELMTLALLDGTSPAVDPTYLPNTQAVVYWASQTYAAATASAWSVDFSTGGSLATPKASAASVRLVRGTQF